MAANAGSGAGELKNKNLYLVASGKYADGGNSREIARVALEEGIDILQMREKGESREKLLGLGKYLRHLCSANGVIFIVNDDPFLAEELNADGVHLGQEDIRKYGLTETRKLVGRNAIIGLSTHSMEQFKAANEADTDYIAFGPIFPTPTKDYSIGTDSVREVLREARKPVVFIGGITLENIGILLEKGARNIAVIRAITRAKDIRGAVRAFRARIENAGNDTG